MGVLVGQLCFLRPVNPKARGVLDHLFQGFTGRCPQCAAGSIFNKGLHIADECPTCGLKFSDHDTGDGPQLGGIFILGIIVLAVTAIIEFNYMPPMWVHMAIATPLVFIGTLVILRPLKGMLVTMQYRYRCVDQEDKHLNQM